MKLITVEKSNGERVQVAILKHKEVEEYSFVNLTKGHICPCKFGSYLDAINELNVRLEEGLIKSWATTERVRQDGTRVQEIIG